ncbi:hypothetical protein BD324DRAFT_187113 [Kockovaella imperatae]|uniref:Uncharacterized protein n=1 Tax=Kockovaella imperatae TaxID=4999 RepID=A0A1Y1UA69_9TREE|nr:hypothetical protein BD324DRAFT_187113 [Kockovaella imperatae]ORX33975.1 hypothetical protein BD324DRAFT_187113 [Kockovaella imperatae]
MPIAPPRALFASPETLSTASETLDAIYAGSVAAGPSRQRYFFVGVRDAGVFTIPQEGGRAFSSRLAAEAYVAGWDGGGGKHDLPASAPRPLREHLAMTFPTHVAMPPSSYKRPSYHARMLQSRQELGVSLLRYERKPKGGTGMWVAEKTSSPSSIPPTFSRAGLKKGVVMPVAAPGRLKSSSSVSSLKKKSTQSLTSLVDKRDTGESLLLPPKPGYLRRPSCSSTSSLESASVGELEECVREFEPIIVGLDGASERSIDTLSTRSGWSTETGQQQALARGGKKKRWREKMPKALARILS